MKARELPYTTIYLAYLDLVSFRQLVLFGQVLLSLLTSSLLEPLIFADVGDNSDTIPHALSQSDSRIPRHVVLWEHREPQYDGSRISDDLYHDEKLFALPP